MNIAKTFATHLATISSSTIGQDLFIGNAPSSAKAPDAVWWVQASGGNTERLAQTGERMKSYLVEVRYRSRDYEDVYEKLHTVEEALNAEDCIQLDGYETIRIEAVSFPIDDDLDLEDRKIGLLAVTITTYKT